jgi:FkbM family methyltransferase
MFLRGLLSKILRRKPLFQPYAAYLGDHTMIVRTAQGFRLYVDTRDISLAPHIIMDGIWEPNVTALLNARVKQGMRVIDVGANFGYHSLHLAMRVGAEGKLVCFEANPRLAGLLTRSLEVNGFRLSSRVVGQAASDVVGETDFGVFDLHMGGSSFLVGQTTADEFNDRVTFVRVQTTTLDMACAELGAVDFIKIDAEGAEAKVIAGAQELIGRSPDLEILMEFFRGFFPSHDDARAFLSRFAAAGFSLRKLRPDGSLSPADTEALLASDALEELLLSRRPD